jgi:uncharacterized membrane protein
MSELIVAGFIGQFTADQVLLDLLKMQQVHLIDLDDAAVAVRKSDGTITIKQTSTLVMADAALGSGCGLLIGAVCLNPLMGTLVGGIVGAAVGNSCSFFGERDVRSNFALNFFNDVADTLTPDSSAIFVLVSKGLSDQVAQELKKFSAKLLRTSLSPKNEQELNEILQQNITLQTECTDRGDSR